MSGGPLHPGRLLSRPPVLGITDWTSQFAGAISWRDPSIGIVADGVTDNTAALNALPSGVPIIGDGANVLFTGQWLLQSNLLLWVQPQTQMISSVHLTNASAAVTQTDTTTALTNVKIYGLNLKKDVITHLGRMMLVYINGFTLDGFKIGTNNGFLHIRGSDQEGYGTVTDSATASGGGRVGIRHYGNAPKVTTTGGKKANVWFHDCNMISGDGVFQVSQTDQGPFANVAADDILYENCYGVSTSGPVILNGQADRIGATFTAACTNITYRGVSGIGSARCVYVQNSDNPTADMTDITIQNGIFDASQDTDVTSSLYVVGDISSSSNVRRVKFINVTVISPFLQGFRATGNVFDSSFVGGSLGAPRSLSAGYCFQLKNTTNFLLDSSTVNATFGAVQVGPNGFTAASPTISNNTLTGVTDQKAGVLFQNVDSAVASANVMTAAAGTTHAKGYIFLATDGGSNPGTTNTSVTGGDVSAMTNSPTIIFIAGQGNTVTGVTGSPNYT